MSLIGEFFVELIFPRIIVSIFGYYTLLAFYKLTSNQKGTEWLNKAASHEGEEFGKGCLISIAGLISFSSLFILIGYVVMLIK